MSGPDFKRGKEEVPPEELDLREAHWHLSSMPGEYDENGLNQGFRGWNQYDQTVELGYRMAFTEWNWTGWGFQEVFEGSDHDWHDAAALGVAAMWHGILRDGNQADIATQSMLIGCGWNIAAVQYPRDPDDNSKAWYGAQGRCSLFYSEHHGDRMLAVEAEGIPTHQTIYRIKWNRPRTTSHVDSIATASDDALFIHLVHRDPQQAITLEIDLDGFAPAGAGIHWLLLPNEGERDDIERFLHEERRRLSLDGKTLRVELPPNSISCLEFPLK